MIRLRTIRLLLEYYTPKSTLFQENLYILKIFVNYDDFYVNAIMSTS